MKQWSIEECEGYAKQLRDTSRANTAEHAAQAIEFLLGLVKREWVGLKAYALLRWAETEMRYAGWDTRLNDQHGRTDVYEAIKEFLP